mmetsp:Transcript_66659/g.198359  ORF Transcript_66659/g.198359 Transcript_66659/m.198359 type:complete len:250 (+) Transcript_66659:143-892(+)
MAADGTFRQFDLQVLPEALHHEWELRVDVGLQHEVEHLHGRTELFHFGRLRKSIEKLSVKLPGREQLPRRVTSVPLVARSAEVSDVREGGDAGLSLCVACPVLDREGDPLGVACCAGCEATRTLGHGLAGVRLCYGEEDNPLALFAGNDHGVLVCLEVHNQKQEDLRCFRDHLPQRIAEAQGGVDLARGIDAPHEEPRLAGCNLSLAIEAVYATEHVLTCDRGLEVVVPEAAPPTCPAKDHVLVLRPSC